MPVGINGEMIEPTFYARQRDGPGELERRGFLRTDAEGDGAEQQKKEWFHRLNPLLAAVGEIIEQRHTVGFRPNSDLACFGEAVIARLDGFRAVERHDERVARKVDAQR